MGSGHIMFSNLQCGSFLQLYRTSPVVGSGTCVIYKADEAKFNFHLKRVYTFNNKSGDLLEVHFRLRPAAPFSKLSVTLQDQNPIFKSKYNNKRAGPSQQTEKESCCLVFLSSTKREIRHYHVVVVQRRLKNEQKSVMHVQSCCFANLNLLLFFRSRCRLRRRCLSTLIPTAFRGSVNIRYFEKRAPCSTDGCNL